MSAYEELVDRCKLIHMSLSSDDASALLAEVLRTLETHEFGYFESGTEEGIALNTALTDSWGAVFRVLLSYSPLADHEGES